MKSVMLVFKPMAAKAVTIKNLLAVFIMPDRAEGITPTLLRIASRRKPPINQGMILKRLTFLPSPEVFSSFCLMRVPTQANTNTVGMIAMVRVS